MTHRKPVMSAKFEAVRDITEIAWGTQWADAWEDNEGVWQPFFDHVAALQDAALNLASLMADFGDDDPDDGDPRLVDLINILTSTDSR